MAKDKKVRDLLRARPSDGRFRMADVDADSSPGLKRHKQAALDLENHRVALFDLQERLYAEHKRSLLIVLQGMDGSGKDGTVTHVIGNLNPQGVQITGFKAPSPEERRHGFLWRIRKRLPPPGEIGIFNRSHYEDVLIARVHNLAPPPIIDRRYEVINRFERDLVRHGTRVLKLCLHISYAEQRRRFLDRLKDPNKRWKFSVHDIDERAYWDDYMSAYSIAITRCSTEWAPWYVVPADDKIYRNWAVAKILLETLEEMNPQFPQPKLNIAALMKRLKS
jgi:PPK2 family polyphosphate:nucleotide phosphotransferase